jgi:hypothetical protein
LARSDTPRTAEFLDGGRSSVRVLLRIKRDLEYKLIGDL